MTNVEYEITAETKEDFRLRIKCCMNVGIARKLLYIMSSRKKEDKDVIDVPATYFNYIKNSFSGVITNVEKELSATEKKKIILTYFYVVSANFAREGNNWMFVTNIKGTYV